MVVYGIQHPDPRSLTRPLLEYAARIHWDLTPPLQLERTDRGKPFFPDHPELHFNISHSGTFIVCALSNTPVGVDIQVHRPSCTAFLDRLCSDEERAWLLARQDSPAAFARLWTMKESRCKWSGQGLTRPISNIVVPLPLGDERHLSLDTLTFSLRSGPDWQLCLCSAKAWDGEVQWITNLSSILTEE